MALELRDLRPDDEDAFAAAHAEMAAEDFPFAFSYWIDLATW